MANALVDRLIAEQRFSAIVLDDSFRKVGDTTPGYALAETLFEDPSVFWTRSGAPSRPQLVYRPEEAVREGAVDRALLGEMSLATPAVANGSVIIRTASKLYRIGRPR